MNSHLDVCLKHFSVRPWQVGRMELAEVLHMPNFKIVGVTDGTHLAWTLFVVLFILCLMNKFGEQRKAMPLLGQQITKAQGVKT